MAGEQDDDGLDPDFGAGATATGAADPAAAGAAAAVDPSAVAEGDEGARTPEELAEIAAVIAAEERESQEALRQDPKFQRVNDKLAASMAREAALEARLAGYTDGVAAAARPAAAAEAAAPPVDVKALRKLAGEKMLEGNMDEYAELNAQADQEMLRLAREEGAKSAHEASTKAVAEYNAAQEQAAVDRTAARLAREYPFLDSTNEDAVSEVAIDDVRAFRASYLTKGYSPVEALEAAVKKVAALASLPDNEYGVDPASLKPAGTAGAPAGGKVADLGAQRQAAALQRAGKTSLAQPAPANSAGAVGARSGAAALNPSTMSQEQIDAVPAGTKEDRKRMFAGELGGA